MSRFWLLITRLTALVVQSQDHIAQCDEYDVDNRFMVMRLHEDRKRVADEITKQGLKTR